MINPTIKNYIDDLIYDNQCMFAQNASIKEKCKDKEREILSRFKLGYSLDNCNRIFALIGSLMGLYSTAQFNNKKIAENLDKIRGLRNGTLKEI